MVNQKTPIQSGRRLAILWAEWVDDRFSDTSDGDGAPPRRDKAHEKEVDAKEIVEPANRVLNLMEEVESHTRRAIPEKVEERGRPEAAVSTPVGD